jgi:hypothetical protein
MKVGDKVWSSAINGGIITVGHVATVDDCVKEGCSKKVITLNEDYNSGAPIPEYHAELFVVLEGY